MSNSVKAQKKRLDKIKTFNIIKNAIWSCAIDQEEPNGGTET